MPNGKAELTLEELERFQSFVLHRYDDPWFHLDCDDNHDLTACTQDLADKSFPRLAAAIAEARRVEPSEGGNREQAD